MQWHEHGDNMVFLLLLLLLLVDCRMKEKKRMKIFCVLGHRIQNGIMMMIDVNGDVHRVVHGKRFLFLCKCN